MNRAVFPLMILFLLSANTVHGMLVWTTCSILQKDSNLNAECSYDVVYIYGEKVKSLQVLSYPKDISKEYLANFSPEKVQEQIFNNKIVDGKSTAYNGFKLWWHKGNYEILVNNKYLKVNVYSENSCPKSEPIDKINTIPTLSVLIIIVTLIGSIIAYYKKRKK